jgi:hypothetical protein
MASYRKYPKGQKASQPFFENYMECHFLYHKNRMPMEITAFGFSSVAKGVLLF